MKIALVHDFLVKLGGAERVLKVLSEMFPKAPIYTLIYDEAVCGKMFPRERVITSGLQKLSRFFGHRYLFPFYPREVEKWDLSEFDVVISSSNSYAHGVITSTHTKHICYYHSPMRYAWDWTYEYREENGLNGIKGAIWSMFLKRLRMWDLVASARPDIVIANSENVAGRIWKYYRRKSHVLYPPVTVERFKVRRKHEDFFLIVSTLSPYKKIDLAVNLFNKIKQKLVIIGDGAQKDYLDKIAGPTVEVLGFKNDEVTKEYMENCKAFIFPGEEDFGIAPIEAMACGKPVLAYGKGGALESIVAGETGEFFTDQNLISMEHSFNKLLKNYGRYKPSACRKQAERFSREIFERGIRKFIRMLNN